MFSALLFAHDSVAGQSIEQLAASSGLVAIQKTLNTFPHNYEFSVLLNTYDPDLIFLDLSDWEVASAAAMTIHSLYPNVAIVGFGGGWSDQMVSMCGKVGVSEVLTSPVTVKELQSSVARAIHKLRSGVQENLVAFLPAKAGSGCTTVALNIAGRLAGPLGQKVLLMEGDLNSGILSILVNVKSPQSILDALENSSNLDYTRWSECVSRAHDIDLLLSARSKPLPSWGNYHHLLEYVRPRYDTIIVDLPELVNDATEEIIFRAKFVFIVCTPELPSLRLAQRRCRELESRGVPVSRVGIIVNRWHETDITEADIEAILGHGVAAVFPNDYVSVQQATSRSGLVSDETVLGQTFLSLARILAGVPEPFTPAPEPPKSMFQQLKSFGRRKGFVVKQGAVGARA
jgi:pilus assembly protein CpaE